MFKSDIVNAVSAKTRITKRLAECVVNTILEEITDALSRDEPVMFTGFGKFETKHRNKRLGRNIGAGTQVDIPSCVVPVFRPGRLLKSAVQDRRESWQNPSE